MAKAFYSYQALARGDQGKIRQVIHLEENYVPLTQLLESWSINVEQMNRIHFSI